jgi:hypothetical protein
MAGAGFGPGAAGAVEPLRLVHARQRCRAFYWYPLLQQGLAEGFECSPSAGGLMVGMNGFPGHGELSVDVTIFRPVKDRGAEIVFSNRISIFSIAQVRV